MRACLPVLCRERRAISRRRGRADGCCSQLCPLRGARTGSRDHALEFSVLAGVSICSASLDGGKRWAPETRRQRPAVRACDSRVTAVTLTGSEKAGSAVASIAARHIKKSVLELGGSDAFIVMPSADFESALGTAIKARTINNGQSCIAAKRFLVADQIYDEFLRQFVERIRALKIGDPLDEATEIGPLATEQILEAVDEQVQKSITAGAKLLTGGNRIHGPGFFYEPTVLVDVPIDSPAYCEEIFGPVASFFRVRDVADAVEIANATTFGLGASAWTNDRTEQDLFASELEAGMVFVNAMVASDPRLPFGGVKRSGSPKIGGPIHRIVSHCVGALSSPILRAWLNRWVLPSSCRIRQAFAPDAD